MTIRTSRPTVATPAARLDTWAESDFSAGDPPQRYGQSVVVHNKGAVSVFLGGPDVTTENGFELPAGATFTVDMSGADRLYARTAADTSVCDVLQTGV